MTKCFICNEEKKITNTIKVNYEDWKTLKQKEVLTIQKSKKICEDCFNNITEEGLLIDNVLEYDDLFHEVNVCELLEVEREYKIKIPYTVKDKKEYVNWLTKKQKGEYTEEVTNYEVIID